MKWDDYDYDCNQNEMIWLPLCWARRTRWIFLGRPRLHSLFELQLDTQHDCRDGCESQCPWYSHDQSSLVRLIEKGRRREEKEEKSEKSGSSFSFFFWFLLCSECGSFFNPDVFTFTQDPSCCWTCGQYHYLSSFFFHSLHFFPSFSFFLFILWNQQLPGYPLPHRLYGSWCYFRSGEITEQQTGSWNLAFLELSSDSLVVSDHRLVWHTFPIFFFPVVDFHPLNLFDYVIPAKKIPGERQDVASWCWAWSRC